MIPRRHRKVRSSGRLAMVCWRSAPQANVRLSFMAFPLKICWFFRATQPTLVGVSARYLPGGFAGPSAHPATNLRHRRRCAYTPLLMTMKLGVLAGDASPLASSRIVRTKRLVRCRGLRSQLRRRSPNWKGRIEQERQSVAEPNVLTETGNRHAACSAERSHAWRNTDPAGVTRQRGAGFRESEPESLGRWRRKYILICTSGAGGLTWGEETKSRLRSASSMSSGFARLVDEGSGQRVM